MKTRIRADQLAFEQGLAESRAKAKSLIMAGQIAFADREPIAKPEKPGQLFDASVRFKLLPGREYASRGARKLLTLLDDLDLSVEGFVCADAGASTGGFTDCLLQRGAAKVYAIDVGKNQLHEKLRADPRVVNLEGVNLRYAEESLLPEKADFICGDLSFISLTLIIPSLSRWLKPGGKMALLIKPQFELSPREVPKGVVRKEEDRKKATDKIISFCAGMGLRLVKILPSKIKGPKGNQEYIALFEES